MKRILSCISACLMSGLILIQMSCPVYAMIQNPDWGDPPGIGDGGEQDPAESIQILGVNTDYEEDDTRFQMLTIEQGESLDKLLLPEVMDCVTDREDMFGISRYFCPVIWDLSKPVDTQTPGRITINGTLKPPVGYKMAQGISPAVTLSVTVLGERSNENTETLRHIKSILPDIYLTPHGKTLDTLILTDKAYCFTQNPGEYFNCPMKIDISQVDTNKSGAYITSATPVLPSGFAPPKGFMPVKITVHVMPADVVDFSAAYYEPSERSISCNWIYKIPEDMPVQLEYAIDKGEWIKDDIYLLYSRFRGTSLKVRLEQLELQKDYYFRMTYGAQGNEKTSDILHVRLENPNFTESEDTGLTFDIGGNRDGGDIEGDNQPDWIQPLPPIDINLPPTAPIANNPQELNPVEVVTETSTILSGARLAQLMENTSTVLFEKQGVAVELPTSFLSGLSLANQQLLEVVIKRPTQETFSLFISSNKKDVTLLPGTTVRIPWDLTNSDEPLECVNKDGVHISDVALEKSSGTIQFTIFSTGSYRIQKVKNNIIPENSSLLGGGFDIHDNDISAPGEGTYNAEEAVKETKMANEQTIPGKADIGVMLQRTIWIFLTGLLLTSALFVLWRWRCG